MGLPAYIHVQRSDIHAVLRIADYWIATCLSESTYNYYTSAFHRLHVVVFTSNITGLLMY